ncbi:MAG: hypothetical protein Q7T41_01625 [Candidatus Saccharibacteria bacterium]|nr:hypothetical protein [Candidatus Saccharibacteria bacterium]
MKNYDFFIAGRWRNKDEVMKITNVVRSAGYKAHCFLENDYSEALARLGFDKNAMESENTEKLPQDHPLIQEIFKKDLEGQIASESFLLVLPAGTASHIESGISYGMGKKCYAVGRLEKTETLYCIFEEIFPDVQALKAWLDKN